MLLMPVAILWVTYQGVLKQAVCEVTDIKIQLWRKLIEIFSSCPKVIQHL